MAANISFNPNSTGLSEKRRYLLRLAPDFGIINLVEKYYIEKALRPGAYDGLFYYNNDFSGLSGFEFRRALLCSNYPLSISGSNDYINEEFHIGDKYYYIFINQEYLGMTQVNISPQAMDGGTPYLIGVCF